MSDPAPSSPTPSPGSRPDLARLRIDRGSGKPKPYRGFPWLQVLVVLGLVGAVYAFRTPLLGLVQTVRGTAVRTAPVVRVVPGAATEGDVAANGYVVANRIASLATALSGRLVEVHAEEGDVVEENAVVGRIQYDDFEASLAAVRQQLDVIARQRAAAVAELEQARLELPGLEAGVKAQQNAVEEAETQALRLERDVERNRPLYESRRIDEGTWDQVQTAARAARDAVETAQARLRVAELAVTAWQGRVKSREAAVGVLDARAGSVEREIEIAEIQVEKTRIRAPFRGLVIRKDAELGEVIAPTGAGNGRGSVFTIVDPASLEVQVELSERRIRQVREGDRATIFLDADPDQGFPGAVRKIWPRADRSKGTIEVRVTFDERPDDVRPEMAARVVFQGEASEAPAEAEEPYVSVPASAVRTVRDRTFVFLFRDGTARQQEVTVGETRGTSRIVASGLEGGETLILDPPTSLRDGDNVRQETP